MLEPAGPGAFPFRTDPFRSLVSRLEGISPPSGVLLLTLLARPHPQDGLVRYWSSDLNVWLPPLPQNRDSPRENILHVLASRTETEWLIRTIGSDARPGSSGEILWKFPLAQTEERVAGSAEKPEGTTLLSDRSPSLFSSRPEGSLSPAEEAGPLPAGMSGAFLPERCWFDIRWPDSPGDPQEDKKGVGRTSPSSAVPFRLEVAFSGGQSIVLGGVYEPDVRSISLSARSSSGPILSRWEQMRPEVAQDLSRVLNIRLDNRRGRQDGSKG